MAKIAGVVNNLTEPATTRQVMELLSSENFAIISAYLCQLVTRGQIQRVAPGLYASLDYEGGTNNEK